MPRPCKCRRICSCSIPAHLSLVPQEASAAAPDALVMTFDEYEAIRLIDLKGLSQSQCAQRLNVGRTTAQTIYNHARQLLAQCLVKGRALCLQGGNYELCQGSEEGCACCPENT